MTSKPVESVAVRRGAGRPRDPGLEARLKQVALEQLAEHGFSGLTIEKICAGAGVPRATFYRRWPTAAAAVSDAFNERFESGILETTGELQADLESFAARLLTLYNEPLLGRCLLFILTEAKLKPELTVEVAEAERTRRRRNIAALDEALATEGHDAGLSPRLILATLNGLAQSTFLSNRRFGPDDFRVLISKLLQPSEAPVTPD